MKESSLERMTKNGDTVEIPLREYQELLADSIYADMASDIIESMPADMRDMLGDDDERWDRWVEMREQLRG